MLRRTPLTSSLFSPGDLVIIREREEEREGGEYRRPSVFPSSRDGKKKKRAAQHIPKTRKLIYAQHTKKRRENNQRNE